MYVENTHFQSVVCFQSDEIFRILVLKNQYSKKLKNKQSHYFIKSTSINYKSAVKIFSKYFKRIFAIIPTYPKLTTIFPILALKTHLKTTYPTISK